MDFSLPANVSEFVARTEIVAEGLQGEAFARAAKKEISKDVISSLAEAGLLGVNIPPEFGGLGLGVVAYAYGIKTIAKADAAVAVTMAVTNMVGEVISQFGSLEQKTLLPKLAGAHYFAGAFALSEPHSGSDASAMRTKAVQRAEKWVLNGEKLWITSGDRAGVVVVWARTGVSKNKGISCFLVPGGISGMKAGRPEEKLGQYSSHTVSLSLDDVCVDSAALLGREGEGFKVAMMALDGGRIGIASQSIGIGEAAFDYVCAFLRKIKVDSARQGLLFKVADMKTQLEAAWMMTLRAAWMKEKGLSFSCQAAMAKLKASEVAGRVVEECFSVLADLTGTADPYLFGLLGDVRVTRIYEGTSEIQRLVIGRSVLK